MITLKCKKHPKYQGKLSPKANCPECIALYAAKLRAEVDHILVLKNYREV